MRLRILNHVFLVNTLLVYDVSKRLFGVMILILDRDFVTLHTICFSLGVTWSLEIIVLCLIPIVVRNGLIGGFICILLFLLSFL